MLVRLITILTSLLLLVVVVAQDHLHQVEVVLVAIELVGTLKHLVVEAQVSLPCLVLLEIIRLQLVLEAPMVNQLRQMAVILCLVVLLQ
jgi:hypothetical protein